MSRKIWWQDFTAAEFANIDPNKTIAILPTAAIEQHGPHLPVGVDTFLNRGPLDMLAEAAPAELDIRILPVQAVGKSNEHIWQKGTISGTAHTLIDLWFEIGQSVSRAGVKKLVIVNSHGGNVSIIDVASHKVIHTITFAIPGVPAETIQAVGINLSPDGKWGFVALGPANRIAVVDAASFAVKKYLLVGQRVWHMDFSFDGKTLYTANGVSNDMSVIDVGELKVTKSVPVGHLPWGVVYGP